MGTGKSHSTKAAHNEQTWYTAAQLSDRWGVTVTTIRRWHYDGKLRGHTFSRAVVRFAAADVAEFEREALSR
jgi:predicted site-specific integrase-resolvase